MINFKVRGRLVAKFLIGALLAMGGACSSPTSGVGGESHFACNDDTECTPRNADDFCYQGECTSQLALAGPVPGPCGKSPFVGKYLWKVGNCEMGALSPVDAASCSTTFCAKNVRTFDECVGDALLEMQIDGLTMTYPPDGPVNFIKHVDCKPFSKNDQAACQKLNCELALVKDLYAADAETLHPDNLWYLMNEPWPGTAPCGDALNALNLDLSSCEQP
jgi:hypothetical protein